MRTSAEFLSQIDNVGLKTIDRVRALLWWVGRSDFTVGLSTTEICKLIESAGYPKQNISRIGRQLSADKKIIARVPGKDAWRLRPHGRKELDSLYESIASLPKKVTSTDSVLPRSLFTETRGYIENVVSQINAAYDFGLFDCCTVMCRRLLETLIIEVYESVGRQTAIQTKDGNYYMFADLLRILDADSTFSISRNGRQGLRDFKKLGDLSAHNRKFNARKEDVDRVRDGIRIAAEELLHTAKLI